MFKLAVSCSGFNFLRYFGVRIVSANKCNYPVSRSGTQSSGIASLLSEIRRGNSHDARIRNFYEYPDVNPRDEPNLETPYTRWEGAENRYAHSIMEKIESYRETLAPIPAPENSNLSKNELEDLLNKNYRLETLDTLVNNFRTISHHAKENHEIIYDPKFDNVLTSIASNSGILSDDQILHTLKSLTLWFIETNESDSSFSILYTSLDAQCKSRAVSWSDKKLLFVADHWYRLRLICSSKFMSDAIIRLGKNPGTLPPSYLVQLMFYASVSRSSLINFREVEARLKLDIESLSIDEIAVISLGFFKSQNVIRDRSLHAVIIQKTIEEIDSINEISLAAILKIVRYSIHVNDLQFLCKLLENTIPQIPRLSVTCLVHVILAAANRSLFYADLLNAVAARFYREISKLRMKDIRCLVFALSSFNYVPEKQPNIFERIVEELNESKRQDELKRYPKCFATCLHHLSILNIHPKNLIAQALDPESIQKAYGSNDETIRREIFALDLDIDAEIPDYRGPRLDTQMRESVAMRLTDWAPCSKTSQLTIADNFMLDVIRSCEEYLGSKEVVHVDHVLPQYQRPDIIICMDNSNSAIPLSSTLSKLPFGTVKHPPIISVEKIRWLALVIGSGNSRAKNTRRPLGHICAKLRQLEHIGYSPIVIFWQDWRGLRNDVQKFQYLRSRVFS